MRDLRRNKRLIYHAEYTGEIETEKDEYGNEISGSETYKFTDPLPYSINIAPPTGEISAESFGGLENYDAVLSTTDLGCPIRENSRLWIDEDNIEKPHDYTVVRVAKSLNVIRYAAAKVKVDG